MKKLFVFLALLGLAGTPLLAQGPVTGPYLVDHYSNNLGSGVSYQFSIPANVINNQVAITFSFTEPQILTANTTIPASALAVTSVPANCTITGVKLTNLGATNFSLETDFAVSTGCSFSGGGIFAFFSDGPATAPGTFTIPITNNSPVTLTIAVSTAPDQFVRLVNFGATGTPLTSPTGDVCANIYVFDANQEMAACCSCRITPNGVRTFGVFRDITFNPVTSITPVNGDIKIVSTAADGLTLCTPLTYNAGLTDSLVGFGTHVSTTGVGSFITETQIPAAALSGQEQNFLTQTCQLLRYLGSGKGTCSCLGNPD